MTPTPALPPRTARLLLIGLWALTCAWLVVVNGNLIAPMNFRDPDDALRLVQVRDLLGGQSWFDLTQYRALPPAGVPMHWSRLVDLPLAAMIGALTPLISQGAAERATLVAVPFLDLLALFAIVYALCRALALPRGTALIGAAALGASVSILVQFAPMRIDHHGIQIVFGGLAMLALLHMGHADGRAGEHEGGRMGLLAGLAMACWMQVSIEGLPMAVAMGGVLGLRALWRHDWRGELPAYLLALAGGSALLLFATHYPRDALVFWCDAMSPGYLLPLGATALTLIVTQRLLPSATPWQRAIPLALAGAAGAATFLMLARQCLAGPFETLDPVVYSVWYRSVQEGLPIAMQKPDMRALIVLPALLGLPGSLMGLRAAGPDKRPAWLALIAMQLASFALALDVMRAMSFAHVLALPGNAVLLAALMQRAQRLRIMPLRVILTASAALVSPLGAAVIALAALAPAEKPRTATTAPQHGKPPCATWATLRGLDALPATTLFTPMDIGAHLLVYTHHSVIATSHHRNVAGMKAVIEGLMAPPDKARAIAAATGARYLAFCPGADEIGHYKQLRPNGLIAMLEKGRAPGWLRKVPMRTGETIQVYRIVPPAARDQAGTNLSATPFMQ